MIAWRCSAVPVRRTPSTLQENSSGAALSPMP